MKSWILGTAVLCLVVLIAGCGGRGTRLLVTSPQTQVQVVQGGQASVTVDVMSEGRDFGSAPALSIDGGSLIVAPTAPTQITPRHFRFQLSVMTPPDLAPGAYAVNVTAIAAFGSGATPKEATLTIPVQVVVEDPVEWTLVAAPTQLEIPSGESVQVTLSLQGGANVGSVQVQATAQNGVSVAPASVELEAGNPVGFSVTALPDAAFGDYTVSFTGTGPGGATQTATVTVTIPVQDAPFTLVASPSPLDLGTSRQGWLTLTATGTGTIPRTGTLTVQFEPGSGLLPAVQTTQMQILPGVATQFALLVTSSNETAPGTYSGTATLVSGPFSRTVPVSVIVP
jgi:methionine-rich copper-binding protein CopC